MKSWWLLTNSPKYITIYPAAQTWPQENEQKSSREKLYNCIEYFQQLYLIVDRFLPPNCVETSGIRSVLTENLTQRFTHRLIGRQRDRAAFVERYIRIYIKYKQDEWTPLLALAEFAYNVAVHPSTGKALFEIVYGEIHRSDLLTLDEVQKYSATRESSTEGESLIERIYATREEVTKSFTRAQDYQVRTYNKLHHDVEYKVG